MITNDVTNDSERILRVENLCQYFKMGLQDFKAVDGVSFDIKRGEVLGLVGESGCGKTTTGRSIIKLYDCTAGNVYFDGVRICAGIRSYEDAIKNAKKEYKEACTKVKNGDTTINLVDEKKKLDEIIAKNKEEIKLAKRDHKKCDTDFRNEKIKEVNDEYLPKLEALNKESNEYKELFKEYEDHMKVAKKERLVTKIQMVFQDPISSLDPRMTVGEIISEGLKIKGYKNQKLIDEQVYDVLEKVGLVREHAGRYPHEFSGGQRQRIGVARAVIMKPELIIADEPISALDVSIQAQVINLLNDLRKEMNLTILFIAHDLSVVKYFSDRIAVMFFGHMVELASSDDLFKHPLHPYTRSLLSAIPLPDPRYEKNRKRITYNPLSDHDYSVDKPEMREVEPGHYVSCNEKEFNEYKAICEK